MRFRAYWVLSAVAAAAAFGCGGRQAQLVGTWKARQVPARSSPNLRDVAESAFLGLATQGMTLEFNREGKVKVSQFMGAGEGDYRVEGDRVRITMHSLSPNREIVLRFGREPNTLELDREFASDANVVFEKQ